MFEFLFNRQQLSKEERLLKVLQKNINKPVSALYLTIKAKTLHHNELIRRLRVRWYNIKNTCEWVDWEKHSFYTLIQDLWTQD